MVHSTSLRIHATYDVSRYVQQLTLPNGNILGERLPPLVVGKPPGFSPLQRDQREDGSLAPTTLLSPRTN